MDKTYKTEYERSFLIENLPEPLTRASSHIQIFDNYIADTRLRIRSVRDPHLRERTWILQQVLRPVENSAALKRGEIYLDENEHNRFQLFEGTEIRKNRYFHDFDNRQFTFDVFLGNLWGLNMVKAAFQTESELLEFEPPPFAVFEVTRNAFFFGENLVSKKFEDVRGEVAKVGMEMSQLPEIPDE